MPNVGVSVRDRWAGAVFVLTAVLFQALWLGLPGTFFSLALILTYGLWLTTAWRIRPGLRVALAVGIAVMVLHVTEEYAGGLHAALPALFDRPSWTGSRYLFFNGLWGLLFLTAFATLKPSRPLAALLVLFFAVTAGVANGVVHTGLAIVRGGYFPGLWTAPLCFAVGVWMLRLLYARPKELDGVWKTPARFRP